MKRTVNLKLPFCEEELKAYQQELIKKPGAKELDKLSYDELVTIRERCRTMRMEVRKFPSSESREDLIYNINVYMDKVRDAIDKQYKKEWSECQKRVWMRGL